MCLPLYWSIALILSISLWEHPPHGKPLVPLVLFEYVQMESAISVVGVDSIYKFAYKLKGEMNKYWLNVWLCQLENSYIIEVRRIRQILTWNEPNKEIKVRLTTVSKPINTLGAHTGMHTCTDKRKPSSH